MDKITIIDGVEILEKGSPFWGWLLFFSALFLGVWVYFIPTFIAFKRKHISRYGIFIINLCFGFTFFGWIIALAWSVSKKD
ncbi:superinfection immunity protein [Helicobacter mustelae]|uniref:Putative membrane protein n=1 Tax=Helicobacter mustelae (strain ATCC 43772 / CCUG 25715 / CIP 103759 / LMG 18044 / NCTC 12198 / R85-136P) TaxID=679897 RepID=D3UFJ9_HELM1|nr:superinfection immunity protein [Helicobacter mustelae]CBG39270.1 putative membrane protein [Helicobacter mustelae 12198]SQH70780.1 Uncharacterised protein [Helicobacter mustelae]STP11905.1 Uncharacterised protein [Helicobacter mustelae]STP14148.1 Uncharacterised protein [Helicobacter mustelae]